MNPRLAVILSKANGLALAFALMATVPMGAANAAGLGGSRSSMRLQHRVAEKNDFTFLRTPAQVRSLVEMKILDPVDNSAELWLRDVSFPYARPEVRLFVERIAAEYSLANGEPLVVTSLTRPLSNQPANAHALSVHPTGMAVDFRVPSSDSARTWLETTLLALEKRGVLDVTREKHPSHYHVALFPTKYAAYAATLPPLPPRPVSRPERIVPAPVVVTTDYAVMIADLPMMPFAMLFGFILLGMGGYARTTRTLRERARGDR